VLNQTLLQNKFKFQPVREVVETAIVIKNRCICQYHLIQLEGAVFVIKSNTGEISMIMGINLV
jgi:hypothetical protein